MKLVKSKIREQDLKKLVNNRNEKGQFIKGMTHTQEWKDMMSILIKKQYKNGSRKVYLNTGKTRFKRGTIPWNKGLTYENPKLKGRIITKETRIKIRNKLQGIMPKSIKERNKFGYTTGKHYNINGKRMFFRSNWEANYALYLDWLKKNGEIKKWEYEADVFIFEKIKFGTRSYRPDFKVFNKDGNIEYHEVKGWMDDKSKTKLKRMQKYYPEVKLILIDGKQYNALKRQIGIICAWT